MQPSEIMDWWKRVRPTFDDLLPQVVPQIGNEAVRLERLLARVDETVLCFLGQSGIGKSTLINAIVADADTLLPAGGTGPLTAIATVVRYSDRKNFLVRYQSPAILRGMLLNLEAEQSRRGHGVTAEPASAGDDAEALALDAAVPSERMEGLIKATQTLVKGPDSAPAELQSLIAGLRYALGLQHQGTIDAADRDRLRDLSEALSFAKTNTARKVLDDGPDGSFQDLLQKHAAGSLAPLVAEISVGWPSPILRGGIVLVDLPGVGIAGDEYPRATREFIRQHARGVIMVVGRGVSHDDLELLRTSGFWERTLLAAGDLEADPCDLVVAVTKLDDLVTARLAPDQDDEATIAQVYRATMHDVATNIHTQTVTELGRLSDVETEDADLRQSRRTAAGHVLDALTVHPVSAVDYRKLLRAQKRLPALASEPELTGIPALARRVAELGRQNSAALAALRQTSADRIARIAGAAVDQELASLAEGRREKEALDRLRADLARFLGPLRLEYANRQGQFREFLDSTCAVIIERLVERAQGDASKSVVRYLAALGGAPWSTLRAAVVRGGAFQGKRKIDLADDLAQLFQEPVAAIWGSETGLLREVRARTVEFGEITHDLILQVLDWAAAYGNDVISKDGLEANRRAAGALSGQLGQVGRDAADELRRAVRDRLLERTQPAIAQACRRFVERGDAAGPGVKLRMVSLFADLAQDSMERAAAVARQLLNERFADVRREISEVFDQSGDPFDRTASAVAPEEYIGNATRRAEIIAQLESVRLVAGTAPLVTAAVA
jgi:hypothetical protein